jgi:hypothetical protein
MDRPWKMALGFDSAECPNAPAKLLRELKRPPIRFGRFYQQEEDRSSSFTIA